jgi:O-antigen/teichoic acid export membrane protein
MATAAGSDSTSPALAAHPLAARLRRGGPWIVGGRTLGMAMVLAIHVFLARTLTMSDFASLVLATTIAVCFSMAAMFGVNTLVCRYLAESLAVNDPARARKAVRLAARVAAVGIAGAGFAGWLGVTHWADALFRTPQLSRSAGLIALWIMLLAVSQILAEVFRGLHQLRMAGLLAGVSGGLVCNAVFFVALIVASMVTTLDFRGVILLATVSLLVPIFVAVVLLPRTWALQTSAGGCADHDLPPLTTLSVAREALPIMLVQMLSFAVAQLDIWIVGICCTHTDLAVYAVARRLSLLVAIPLTQVGLAVASTISELYAQGDRRRLELVLRGGATVAFVAASILAVLLVVMPSTVLETIFGPEFRQAAQPLRILCLGQVIYAFTGLCGPALMMTGHQRISLWSLLVAAPVLLLAPGAAVRLGPEAVAAIAALVMAIQNLFQWAAVRILLAVKTHPFFSLKPLRVFQTNLILAR